MLGLKAPDGQAITAKDYKIEQKVTTLGVIAGRTVVQILTDIRPGRRVIEAGITTGERSAAKWKDLLVTSGNGKGLVEIYALHFDFGELINRTNAEIYGAGPDAVLGSYDPDTGKGGGCFEGYWWFDQDGPHEVDFSPLIKAVSHAIPANAGFTPNCWALHPKTFELKSGVQRDDAQCHACGILGEVHATYRFERGSIIPISVDFEPIQQ